MVGIRKMSLLLGIIGYWTTVVAALPVANILTIESSSNKYENDLQNQRKYDKGIDDNKNNIQVVLEENVSETDSDSIFNDVDHEVENSSEEEIATNGSTRISLEEEIATNGSTRIVTAPCRSCYRMDMAGNCRPIFGCSGGIGTIFYNHKRDNYRQPEIRPMGMIGMKQMLSLMGMEKPPTRINVNS